MLSSPEVSESFSKYLWFKKQEERPAKKRRNIFAEIALPHILTGEDVSSYYKCVEEEKRIEEEKKITRKQERMENVQKRIKKRKERLLVKEQKKEEKKMAEKLEALRKKNKKEWQKN